MQGRLLDKHAEQRHAQIHRCTHVHACTTHTQTFTRADLPVCKIILVKCTQTEDQDLLALREGMRSIHT